MVVVVISEGDIAEDIELENWFWCVWGVPETGVGARGRTGDVPLSLRALPGFERERDLVTGLT